MEMSLHRSLKERYATGGDGRSEVSVGRYRIDAVDDMGRLIEVQSGSYLGEDDIVRLEDKFGRS